MPLAIILVLPGNIQLNMSLSASEKRKISEEMETIKIEIDSISTQKSSYSFKSVRKKRRGRSETHGCWLRYDSRSFLSNDRRLESIPDQIKELYRRIGSANKYTSFVAAPQCTLSLNLSDVSAIGIRVSALQCFGTLRSKRYSQINVP